MALLEKNVILSAMIATGIIIAGVGYFYLIQKDTSGIVETIIPGSQTVFSCPVIHVPISSSIMNSGGFRIYNYSEFSNYVLEPGKHGTIIYDIKRGSYGDSDLPTFVQEEEIVINDATFYHQESTTVKQNVTSKEIKLENETVVQGFEACYARPEEGGGTFCYTDVGSLPPKTTTIQTISHSHPGITVTFEPQSETLGFNSSVTVTAKISASSDAPKGTYWLSLASNPCIGAPWILLTIGTEPYTEKIEPLWFN